MRLSWGSGKTSRPAPEFAASINGDAPANPGLSDADEGPLERFPWVLSDK